MATGSAWAQTTLFTYQGALTDAGASAIGGYLLQFKLFDAASGGTQIGPTIADVPVTAANGIFTVQLDFGSTPFGGADRFLEIAVRHNAGESYTTLATRQQIASSPYAIRTISAQQADMALDAQKLGGIAANQYVTTASVGNTFIKNQTSQQASSSFNISGSGIVGGNFGVGNPIPAARVDALTSSGDAVKGVSTTNGRGVWGQSDSWQGVYGKSNTQAGVVGDSNTFYGVFGVTSGASASGIYGSNNASGGTGIIGQSNGGKGVFGSATNGGIGVWGESDSFQGVHGQSNTQAGVVGSSNSFYGVFGVTSGVSASGIYGSNNAAGGTGIIGQSNGGKGVYGSATNGGTGVWGEVSNSASFGVRGLGLATNTTGVKGEANQAQGIGVWGQGDVNTGVYGLTVSGTGVYGRATATGRALYADGNAGQAFDKGGLAKALLFVRANATIDRCFNGTTNESLAGGGMVSTGCGFSVGAPVGGIYTINFDFDVSQRYFSFTPYGGFQNKAGYIVGSSATSVSVSTAFTDQGRDEAGPVSDFLLIVY